MGIKTRDQLVTIIADALGKARGATAISGALLEDRCIDFLNWGQQRMARFHSFHELNATYESAATVDGVKRYPLVTGTNNLGLTRPKDIQSIRLIDGENSRKLERWSDRKFDKWYPRPENFSEGRPYIYIRYGNNVEMFRIPDAAYDLYIRYPQWATTLSSSSQVSDFENKDQLLVTSGILEGYLHFEEYTDAQTWYQRFLGQLSDAVHVEGDVDWEPDAEEFSRMPGGYRSGEPWLDPYASIGDPLHDYPM